MLLPEMALELKAQAYLSENKQTKKSLKPKYKVYFWFDASSFTGGINVINIPLQLYIIILMGFRDYYCFPYLTLSYMQLRYL